MHGLINKSLQCFVRDSYGPDVWDRVAHDIELPFDGFEAMLTYDDAWTDKVIASACTILKRERHSFLEDLGTYLVSHPNTEAVRRLLRLSGHSFLEFLHALDDLQGRAGLAMPDLEMPKLQVDDVTRTSFVLSCCGPIKGSVHVIVGALRAMADDYGALVMLELDGEEDCAAKLNITVVDINFSGGRDFDLGAAWT